MTEHRMSSYMGAEVRKHKRISLALCAVGSASAVMSLIMILMGNIGWVFCLFGFIAFFVAPDYRHNAKVRQAGIDAEELFRNRLRSILGENENDVALYNIPVGKGGDIDCLVMSEKYGVCAFETKSHTGNIKCYGNKWMQIIQGEDGSLHSGNHINNPSRQLGRNIGIIKAFLSGSGHKVWINGIIVFTSPAVFLDIQSPGNVKVVRLHELDSVMHSFGDRGLSASQITEICQLLKPYNGAFLARSQK